MKKLAGLAVIAALTLGGGRTIEAHHSHAMFDTTKEVSLVGTIKRVSFANPHVFLYVEVKDPKRVVTTWAVEMSNITNMERRGIYKSTFKIGEQVTVKVNPLRDGRPGGNYTALTTADGKTYD